VARAGVIGLRLTERIVAWGRRNDLLPISAPRGLGAMIAFDIRARRGDPEGDGAAAKAVCARAFDQGLIILSCGAQGESIRILVPLTANDAVIDEGMAALEEALSVVA